MIWRRLKKASPEKEKEFQDMLASEEVTLKDKFSMLLSGCLVILLPCVAVLILFALLILWIFGAL